MTGGQGLQRVSVSVPLADADLDVTTVIPMFHDWIRRNAVEGLLIDVARYGHVHQGPGIMLVGHEGDYSVDLAGGTPALRYTLKRSDAESPQAAVALAWKRLIGAVAEAAKVGVATVSGDITVRVFDRLRAPNTDETAEAMTRGIEAVIGGETGLSGIRAERLSIDPREPFAVRLTAA
jgi:hypothetical protein